MVNDYDEPDMPREHHHFLWWAGASVINSIKGNMDTANNQENKFMGRIEEQWRQKAKAAPGLHNVKESMDMASNLGMVRYPSNYGVPFSVR